jgi:hypothetical protein
LNLQFWTQGWQLEKEKVDQLQFPSSRVFQKWLGFGDFMRKYGDNLWAMLENSSKSREIVSYEQPAPAPQQDFAVETPTKSNGKKKRRSSGGKGKRGRGKGKEKEEQEEIVEESAQQNTNKTKTTTTITTTTATTTITTTYDSFLEDQERFMAHAYTLGLDFSFLNYLSLLSSPYFSEQLFISIADKTKTNKCNITTDSPTPTPTIINIDKEPTTTTNMDIDETNTNTNTADKDNSDNTSSPTSTPSSTPTPASSATPLQNSDSLVPPPSSLPPQPPQQSTKVLFVDKESEEYKMAQIGCDALDAMARASDTFSMRDLLDGRPIRQDLMV